MIHDAPVIDVLRVVAAVVAGVAAFAVGMRLVNTDYPRALLVLLGWLLVGAGTELEQIHKPFVVWRLPATLLLSLATVWSMVPGLRGERRDREQDRDRE